MSLIHKTKIPKNDIIEFVNRDAGTNGGEDTRCFLLNRIASSKECYLADADFNDLSSLHLIDSCKGVKVGHIYAPFGIRSCWISVIDATDKINKLGGLNEIYMQPKHCDPTRKWYKRVDTMIREFDKIDLLAHPIIIEKDAEGFEIIDGCHRILAKVLKDGSDFEFRAYVLE